ncbi:hypothetical protein [Alienimonas sp. DA493]|uniref:hypothetical protein n=1 Tax=Alienimonas sp. DA493 TaxID=3373605 RepID=UPI003754FCC6
MPLYRIADDRFDGLTRTTFAEAGVTERGHLQRFLRERADVFDPDLLLLAEEFSDWADSQRRVDLLGVDRDGTLVVIELKRGAGEHMELQALRYAAMVSDMTLDRAVRAFAAGLGPNDEADAREALMTHLESDREEDFAGDVRIVLASETFETEITTTVLWLNAQGLDLRCVEMTAYDDPSGGVLLDVRQVIPLPSEERYRVRAKAKRAAERADRAGLTEAEERRRRFWQRVIEHANEREAIPSLFMTKGGTPKRPNRGSQLSHKPGTVAGLDCWVGLEVDGSSAVYPRAFVSDAADETPAAFDQLTRAADQIEAAFGEPLGWDPKDGKRDCIVAGPKVSGSAEVQADWDDLIPAAVDALVRFHAALLPHLDSAVESADRSGG